ncbi:MAG TPA: SDR family NAD(P)-dependent oxidoreductase [Acidimicrobiales bacterium]|jgi:meso-butanediol dehydrogenase/(S,S)-butanediol dehydrogenase/diacetyl reductase
MHQRFTGKRCLVTGAASGLGRATSLRLAAEGGRVVCLDLADAVEETAAVIAAAGGDALVVTSSVSDPAQVEGAVTRAVAHLGGLDVLCNVAGVLRMEHTESSSIDTWNLVIGVNLTGTYLMARHALPHLIESKGNIVNVGSSAGLRGHAYAAAYCASKGGVIHLTKELAEEFKAAGVRANVVCPGGMATPMVGNLEIPDDIEMRLLLKHTSPMGECTPDQVASTVAFLASDEADYITGAVVSVDGGITV